MARFGRDSVAAVPLAEPSGGDELTPILGLLTA